MAINFPPKPLYPLALDSDKTLFKVYNTSQAKTTSNNPAWAEEISIRPVNNDKFEQWGDNGFANISGELFYYDNVEKDENGKIKKLIKCARQIGGKNTTYNKSGTWVRGYVIAEHHNQLVDCMILTEQYILGLQEDVKQLEDVPICADDSLCPEVSFKTSIDTSNANCNEIKLNYDISIKGDFTNFILDFGDGQTTNSSQSGSHIYSVNSKIDPVIKVSNDSCTVVQTPLERSEITEPKPEDPPIVEIPLPPPPVFPNIVVPDCIVPEIDWGFDFPQIVLPQIDINCSSFSIPSFSFPDINFSVGGISIPSNITITPQIPNVIDVIDNIPDVITINGPNIPSLISITKVDIPSQINITPAIPNVINLVPAIPNTITVKFPGGGGGGTISIVSMISQIKLIGPDPIKVNWDPVPTISVNVTCQCCPSPSSTGFMRPMILDDDFIDDFENDKLNLGFELDQNQIGIPSEIKIIAPEFPEIQLKHDIPNFISLISDLPTKIEIIQKDVIPNEIKIINDSLPSKIEITSDNVPRSIKLESKDLPTFISLAIPKFPDIKVDASGIPDSIKVVGIPDVINVTIPSEIKARLELPESLEIPLVYKGGPVPIQFDSSNLLGDGDKPCFALVPCGSQK